MSHGANQPNSHLGSARSLLRILNDILDMAQIEAGKLAIGKRPFSLRGCVAEEVPRA